MGGGWVSQNLINYAQRKKEWLKIPTIKTKKLSGQASKTEPLPFAKGSKTHGVDLNTYSLDHINHLLTEYGYNNDTWHRQ